MDMDFKSTPMDVAIVFRALPNQLAVLYIAKYGGWKELKGVDSILGDSISDEIFPNTF